MLQTLAAALLAAGIGDGGNASAIAPSSREQEVQDKRTHILETVDELRARTPASLNDAQRAHRHAALDELAAYALRGQFIRNTDFPYDMPYFIDGQGTRCAMGHLLEFTGHHRLLLDLAVHENNSFISELIDHPGVLAWLDENGFTLDDIAFIQGPGFGWGGGGGGGGPAVEVDLPPSPVSNPARPDMGGAARPPATGARAPTTGGRRGAGLTATRRRAANPTTTVTWQRWWDLNRDGFLDVHARFSGGRSVTGQQGTARASQRPSPEQVQKMIFPTLEQALADSSDVAATALVSLAKCKDAGDAAHIEALIRDFLHRTRDVNRDYGLLALGLLETDSAREALTEVLLDRSGGRKLLGESGSLHERERSLAAIGLTHCGDAGTVEALWQVLDDERSTLLDLRSSCVMALGILGSNPGLHARIVPGLVKQMLTPTWNAAVVAHVPLALAKVGDPAGLSAIANHVLMFRGTREVRQSCALALGSMAPTWEPEIWKGLHDLARRDPDATARQFAILGLGEIALRSAPADALTPEQQGLLRDQAKFHLDALRGSFRQAADMPWHALSAGLFARRHGDHAEAIVDQLERLVTSDVRDNRAAAAIALGLSHATGSTARLRELIGNASDPMLKAYAAEALGMADDKEAAADLLAALRADSSPLVRYRASIGLALLSDPMVTDDLVAEYTTTGSAPVRAALTHAIGEIGDKRAIPPLLEMAVDTKRESMTRARAVAALGMIGEGRDRPWTYPIRRSYNFSIAPATLAEMLDLF